MGNKEIGGERELWIVSVAIEELVSKVAQTKEGIGGILFGCNKLSFEGLGGNSFMVVRGEGLAGRLGRGVGWVSGHSRGSGGIIYRGGSSGRVCFGRVSRDRSFG